VASGLVSEADLASPLRQMVGHAPNIQILLGEVVDSEIRRRLLLALAERTGCPATRRSLPGMSGPAVQMGGWMLGALAHLAFIPDTENRSALFSKWMWQIATRQRTGLLITGRPDQHLGVDVGLFRAERCRLEPRTAGATKLP